MSRKENYRRKMKRLPRMEDENERIKRKRLPENRG